MSDEKDSSWIWNLALIGIFIASLWWLAKSVWALLHFCVAMTRRKASLVCGQQWVLG